MEKHKAKEADRARAAAKKLAASVKDKLVLALETVDGVLNHESISLAADPLKEPLMTAKMLFEEWRAEANRVEDLGDEDDADHTLPDMKEVAVRVASAKKAAALVTNLFAAIARSRGST